MDIDVIFQIQGGLNLIEISKREAFRNFLVGISKVMDLTLSCSTLEAIYDYSSLAPLPQFPNLTCLRASFPSAVSEMLPTFLASCPNLKSLHLDPGCPDMEKITRSSVPECMLTSLEFVEMEIPIEKYSAEAELVGYILGNASVLRKLILRLIRCTAEDRCQLLEQLLLFPRRSSACQVVVL